MLLKASAKVHVLIELTKCFTLFFPKNQTRRITALFINHLNLTLFSANSV